MFSEIAKDNNISRQAIHRRFIKICDLIIEKKSEIKDLYKNFDTYLDLNKEIDIKCSPNDDKILWKKIIARLILLKNKNVFISNDRENYLIHKILYYKRFKTKQNPQKTFSCKFISNLKPITKNDKKSYIDNVENKLYIDNIAENLGLDILRFKQVIKNIFYEGVLKISCQSDKIL